ncbi:hypothetical protein MUCCIDRAFT_105917 [Mucor lusitanicus CBS 277.49]|uniref:Uncharacterized protein n=1 Tax=Mucor lusitanicus CBS 277.49 TaxID=747725 RepID=A0A162R742_MUCCL|nr:hypothetical protein MUCCIDRAFT_105917 [Mucor lusitanicus CBS 277.49]
MMLSKLTLSTSINLNLSNYKRKRPSSFVSNIGPLIQRIKKSLNQNTQSSTTARRSNTVHCCLSDYQEMSEKHALSASLNEEQDDTTMIRLSWTQETFMYALALDSENSKRYTQHAENWWSTTPSPALPSSPHAILAN